MHLGFPVIIRSLGLLVLVGIVAVSIYVSATDMPFGFDISRNGISEKLASLGPWRGVGIMALMALHSFIPFPAEIVAFMAGRMLGPAWGTFYAWSGAMIGAVLAFGLSRLLGRSFVEAMLSERARDRLKEWSTTKSALALLLARLVPVIAFNLINYAAGLTHVRWWTFLWTTGIGILPLTVIFVVIGERMQGAGWTEWLLFAVAAIVLAFLARGFLRYARRHGWIGAE